MFISVVFHAGLLILFYPKNQCRCNAYLILTFQILDRIKWSTQHLKTIHYGYFEITLVHAQLWLDMLPMQQTSSSRPTNTKQAQPPLPGYIQGNQQNNQSQRRKSYLSTHNTKLIDRVKEAKAKYHHSIQFVNNYRALTEKSELIVFRNMWFVSLRKGDYLWCKALRERRNCLQKMCSKMLYQPQMLTRCLSSGSTV